MNSEPLSSVFLGSDSLLIECAEIWREKGHRIEAVVTDAPRVTAWAKAANLTVLAAGEDYAGALASRTFDYLFAITYLKIIAKAVLALPKHGAINFHDGPLPRYAGLNAPAWALLHRERDYGITFHLMTADIDAGDILKQVSLQINPDETSLSLNTRCFGLAMESFATLTDELASGQSTKVPQTKEGHSYFGRYARPRQLASSTGRLPRPASLRSCMASTLDRAIRTRLVPPRWSLSVRPCSWPQQKPCPSRVAKPQERSSPSRPTLSPWRAARAHCKCVAYAR